jgi:hypothetical protein
MPHVSTEGFVPLYRTEPDRPEGQPVRVRLADADRPVQSLREWLGAPEAAPATSKFSPELCAVPFDPARTHQPQIAPDSAVPQDPEKAGSCPPPIITVTRDGDRVVALHIRCRCGEIMDLVCEYDPAGSANANAQETAAQTGQSRPDAV